MDKIIRLSGVGLGIFIGIYIAEAILTKRAWRRYLETHSQYEKVILDKKDKD